MAASEAVIMSLTTTTLRAAVFGLLVMVVPPGVRAQSSPCGPDTISIYIPEYPNVEGVVLIPRNLQNSYRKQMVQSNNAALQLTITEDPDNPSPVNLKPDSTTLEVEYNALSVPRGFDLTLKKGVDRDGSSATDDDDRNTLQYKLECVDPTDPNTVYYHVLKIQILDGNDNAPQFQGEPYQITVNELTPVGITVYSSISTTDLDNGKNKLVKYSINTASTSQFTDNSVFMLPSEDSAFVVLRQPLDYEAMVNQAGSALLTVYRMNITATDQAQEFTPLSNWAYLNITITDGDDLGPAFIYDSCPNTQFKSCVRPKYSASIESGATTPVAGSLQVLPIPRLTVPTQTVPIRARDGDSLNAVIQCSIAYTVPAGYENRFTVTTSSTGTAGEYQCNVRVSSPINRADVPSLDVVVQATEQTPNSYSEVAVVSLTSSGPSEEDGANVGAIVGAVIGVLATLAVIIIITVICLRCRNKADVPVTEMVTISTGRGDSGTSVLRDTTAVNAGIPLQSFVGSSSENAASQRPSSETDDDYEIADVGSTENSASQRPSSETGENYDIAYETSTQQDQLEPAASTTDPTYIEILDDQVVDNYDRLQMYENTRGHHVYTDLKSQ